MQTAKQFQEELKLLLNVIKRLGRKKENHLRVQALQGYIIQQFELVFKVSIHCSPKNPLSFMEGLCLALSMRGYPHKKIASLLNIHVGTVYTYLGRVCKKLKTSNAREAACLALFKNYLTLSLDFRQINSSDFNLT